eukprot:8469097-Alexandrium_andersonii.AAC.1
MLKPPPANFADLSMQFQAARNCLRQPLAGPPSGRRLPLRHPDKRMFGFSWVRGSGRGGPRGNWGS